MRRRQLFFLDAFVVVTMTTTNKQQRSRGQAKTRGRREEWEKGETDE